MLQYGATAAVSEAKKPRRLQGRALAAVALVSAALGVAASVAFRRGGAIQTTRLSKASNDTIKGSPVLDYPSYCPAGQTCYLACAKGFAGFDGSTCANANVGYCCKPAQTYPLGGCSGDFEDWLKKNGGTGDPIVDEYSCQDACQFYGLIADDLPSCSYQNSPHCAASEFVESEVCQIPRPDYEHWDETRGKWVPAGPREREQCLCGPRTANERSCVTLRIGSFMGLTI